MSATAERVAGGEDAARGGDGHGGSREYRIRPGTYGAQSGCGGCVGAVIGEPGPERLGARDRDPQVANFSAAYRRRSTLRLP